MPAFTFTYAWPLWLLLALPLIWLLGWRSRSSLSPLRRWLVTGLRTLGLVAVVIALMRPMLHRGIHDVSVVYALDISRSVSPAFVQAALGWMKNANDQGRPAQARYVVFADRPQLVETIDDIPKVSVQADAARPIKGSIDQGASNIEAALDAALFGFAPNHAKRLVLLSDGNQTEGELLRALPRLRAQRVRVYGVAAAVSVDNDSWVEAIELPRGVRRDEPVAVHVRVFAKSEAKGKVELSINDARVSTQGVTLSAGSNDIVFNTTFKRQGANSVAAQVITDNDQVPENNTLGQTVAIGARPKVLYVEDNVASAAYLKDALARQGIDLTIIGTDRLVANTRVANAFDAVILSDVPPEKMSDAVTRQLETYVRDQGGGLIFAAGENTYGEKGFSKSALERLLPVKFEGEGKRKELDLVLVLDRSFSMRGQKIELAKSAALATLDLLDEDHRLCVIAFDSQPHTIVPLLAVGNKRRAEDLISSISSSGQTNLFYAMVAAYRTLEESQAKAKHVIVMSDGDTAPPSSSIDALIAQKISVPAIEMARKWREEQHKKEAEAAGITADKPAPKGFPELVALMREKKISVSTVAIGELPNMELLSNVAKWGEGKSYLATTDQEIPQLFVTEAKRILRHSIVEEPFRPIVKVKSEALSGVDFAKGPELKGFVLSKPKQYSEVLLEAKDQAPLLVQTHHGLGKTVAFLSDIKNRWSADWIQWPGFAKLWAQTVREAIRRDAGQELSYEVNRDGKEAVVTLTALTSDGQYRNLIAPKTRVSAPDGSVNVTELPQVGPGRYETRVTMQTSKATPYRFELIESPALGKTEIERLGVRTLFYPYPDEYRVNPPNRDLLKLISEQTGGKFAPKPEDIFAPAGDGGTVSRAIWQYFAAAALGLFLLDILLRRLPWSRRRLANTPSNITA